MPFAAADDGARIVPFEVGGERSMIDGAVLKIYAASGHALPDTDRARPHADILEFVS
ncbi:hypothetical protein Acor_57450 [Acrocarpospora corrugata]|uniref:Uncharacterized protein n=1 Tax=Acrocarpospora corrugata TaxID=35763 RepID=A0A5M3W5V4_9ACTN|nr:hypothetical protein [Acrocarpospora corrugata]GES03679.1 hypothetical protein Acor_57450 [Acrocarpospora corrugata]